MDFVNLPFLNRTALLLALTVVEIGPVSAEVFYDAQLGYFDDDNVSRAKWDNSIFTDTHYDGLFSIGMFSDFDDGLSMTVIGKAKYASYQSWKGLSHTDFGGSVDLRKKIGLGSMVPSVGGNVEFKRQSYDNKVRDQDQWDVSFYWQKRLDEQWDIKIDLGYFISTAKDPVPAGPAGTNTDPDPGPGPGMAKPGDTFDQNAFYLGIGSGFAFAEIHFLTLDYQFRSGDVASTAIPNTTIVDASTAITADTVFGDQFFAYKLDADTHSLSAGWDIAITEQTSITFEYEYQNTDAGQSIEYKNKLISMQLLISF